MDGIYDYTDQPPHFFYVHFLALLSAVYLPLFAIDTAYGAGWGEEARLVTDAINGIIVLLQCIFVVGLRSLGTKMVDPYGDDYEDLSVILYIESTLDNCAAIMNSSRDPSKRKRVPGVQEESPATKTYDAPAVAAYDDEVATQPSSSDSLARSMMNTHGVPVTDIPDEEVAKQPYVAPMVAPA